MSEAGDTELVAKALVYNDNGEFLILQRASSVGNPNKWDLPGGYIKEGEDLITGLKREILEETGLAIEDSGWRRGPELGYSVDYELAPREIGVSNHVTVFKCKVSGDSTSITLDTSENQDYSWVTVENVPSNFISRLKPYVAKYWTLFDLTEGTETVFDDGS